MSLFGRLKNRFKQKAQETDSPDADKSAVLENLLRTGNTAAKPCLLRSEELGGNMQCSFRISGDFIGFNSHSEMDPSYQYEPENSAPFTEYKEYYPRILMGPLDEIYDAAESGKPVGNGYEKSDSAFFSFRTTLDYYGDILYCYAFSDGTAREREMFGLEYCRELEGTPLESKLRAILDEAADTYEEHEEI